MDKFINRILLVLLILCTLGFGAYCLLAGARADHDAPEIRFDTDTVSVSVNDGANALLSGVTAYDEHDGDVTDSLLVEGISAIGEDHCATVTYAAFDRAGNVTKAQRTVSYTDYQGPRFHLKDSLMFRSGISFNLFNFITATDPLDGDLTSRIKATLVSGNSSITQTGIHQVELRVTNSMGDITRLTVPVEVYPATEYNASVVLSEYLVYLKQGDIFQPKQYLQALDTGYNQYPISQLPYDDLDILSDVRTDICGTYTVTYTLTYDNYVGCGRIIVVVEE